MFKGLANFIMLGFMSIALMGCFLDDDDDDAPTPQTQIRVLHASPDAPAVNVVVNGTTALDNVDFGQGSKLLSLNEGSSSIQVDGLLPGNSTATVIGPVNLDFLANTRYDIMAVNTVAAIEPLVIEAPTATIAADSVRAQVVHAAANAPEVDVYVTAPTADLTNSTPLGTFAFKGSLGPVEVPAGDYRIRVTVAGTTNVAFDSGTVALAGGSDLVLAAITNTGNGNSPIKLAVLDGTSSTLILDQATPASVRVIHNSPDAPAVDIVVNNDFTTPLVEDLAFPSLTGYVDVAPNTYNIKVAAANTQTAVIEADLALSAGEEYSVHAINFLNSIEPLVLVDNNRSVATEAKVRLIHGSPTAGNVDIYVTAPGDDITAISPTFSDIPFKTDSGYVSLAAGSYQVRITPTGTKDIAIDTGTIQIANGGVYTAVARDNTGGGLPLGLILMDDFATP